MVLSHRYSPYLGRYVLNLSPQVEPLITAQRSLEATPFTADGNIEAYSFPEAAEAGVGKPWSVKVHNIGDTGLLAFGIVNPSGSPGAIKVTWQGVVYTINPGVYLRIATTSEVPNCSRLDTSGQIEFTAKGDYPLLLWGMHLEGSTWIYDDEKQIPASVTTPQAPWPVTRQYPYENIVLNPGPLLRKVEKRDVGPVDTSVLLGAVLDYTVTYKSGVLHGVNTFIYWNDEKILEQPLVNTDLGKPIHGTLNLGTGRIQKENVLKVEMSQAPIGFNIATYDIVLTLGYSEEPAEEPKPPFQWPELAWWQWAMIGGFGLGVVYIIVKKPSMPAMPTIITVPYPVLRAPKEGE